MQKAHNYTVIGVCVCPVSFVIHQFSHSKGQIFTLNINKRLLTIFCSRHGFVTIQSLFRMNRTFYVTKLKTHFSKCAHFWFSQPYRCDIFGRLFSSYHAHVQSQPETVCWKRSFFVLNV